MMETESTTMGGRKPPSLPPALCLMHARSRTSKVLDLDSASSGPPTPPLRPPVTVPFLWEEAPGKPKLQETEASAPPPAPAHPLHADGVATAAAGGDHDDGARARPMPLKLPPRLQAAATAEYSLSPNTVLQGPYGGCGGKKPPWPLRRSGSTASCRRKPGAGGGLFSWRKAAAAAWSKKNGHDHDAAPLDASCCSPAASSASSSSSSSLSYCGDDHGRGAHRQQHDGCEDPEDGEDGAKRSVRITRFRRNRSLPSITTSPLWASIRKSVKQITPWKSTRM